MILRCIDVEDMRIQTERQAKRWIDVIEHRLKRLQGYSMRRSQQNKTEQKGIHRTFVKGLLLIWEHSKGKTQ